MTASKSATARKPAPKQQRTKQRRADKTPESFSAQCYRLLKSIPRGRVTTYQDLAHALGCRAYRAVGGAMNRNPDAPKVPCHRVVHSDGRVGNYAFGVSRKISLLRSEGVSVQDGMVSEFAKKRYRMPAKS